MNIPESEPDTDPPRVGACEPKTRMSDLTQDNQHSCTEVELTFFSGAFCSECLQGAEGRDPDLELLELCGLVT